jgi:hypothetical protein
MGEGGDVVQICICSLRPQRGYKIDDIEVPNDFVDVESTNSRSASC